ncbi:DUF2695 domain-containing protein [Alkaliphilus sp. B6464]|uniref:DUF2695 domain-containing protein n=1 Tax=Alkaliphilus sp. B6464 TaxID=2731219 RepID=UPI001BAC3CC0|nr:DUF2695 domain-containing protein [Alkaliphilus sp. B6464]QUH21858.1 DUF2695 domain-containing protein [Alkaliphilus sp. B6464]
MGMSKAKKASKARKREIRERIKTEQIQAKERRIMKAEINRRFNNGQKTFHIPEDNYAFNDRIEDKDFKILSELAWRMFFTKLAELSSKNFNKITEDPFALSEQCLQAMGYKRDKIELILETFKKYGGHDDMEVMLNVYTILYSNESNENHLEYI